MVTEAVRESGIENFEAHNLRRPSRSCRKAGDLGADQVPIGAFLDPEYRALPGSEQEIAVAVNDGIGL